ncbi:DMT family transporter [Hathewaya massiliensis]|uniref:DMT family transporter n=1 Tax=Hathewaya massiliensis TaxID=1964382 RepID=UPI00115744A5|nr:DMT family transporter [Hathewaya massiliensis]
MKKINGIIYAILSSMAFGAMPIFAKLAYNNGSNPTTVLSFRFLITCLVLLVYFGVTKTNFKVTKKQFLILLGIGVIGYTVTCQMLFRAYNYMGVGLVTAIHFVYPAFVCIIGYLFFKEKLGKNKVIALILSAIGVYVLVGLQVKSISMIGVLLAFFSGIAYGSNIIALSMEEIKNLDNKVITFYSSLFAGITMVIIGVLKGELVLKINSQLAFSYIGISLISTILAVVLFLKAIKIIGASSAAILSTFEPIVSIVLSILIFGEVVTAAMIVGTLLILASVVLLAIEK